MLSNDRSPESIAGYKLVHAVQLDKWKTGVIGANHKAVQPFVNKQLLLQNND